MGSKTSLFSDWSMGFRNVDKKNLANVSGFSELGSDEFWENIKRKVCLTHCLHCAASMTGCNAGRWYCQIKLLVTGRANLVVIVAFGLRLLAHIMEWSIASPASKF